MDVSFDHLNLSLCQNHCFVTLHDIWCFVWSYQMRADFMKLRENISSERAYSHEFQSTIVRWHTNIFQYSIFNKIFKNSLKQRILNTKHQNQYGPTSLTRWTGALREYTYFHRDWIGITKNSRGNEQNKTSDRQSLS